MRVSIRVQTRPELASSATQAYRRCWPHQATAPTISQVRRRDAAGWIIVGGRRLTGKRPRGGQRERGRSRLLPAFRSPPRHVSQVSGPAPPVNRQSRDSRADDDMLTTDHRVFHLHICTLHASHRILHLRQQVEQQRRVSADAVAAYVPLAGVRIDDLAVSPVAMLRGLPGVAEVEVMVAVERPTHRIIHVRDWHYVPKPLYAADLHTAAGKPLSEAEVDALHEALRLEVELVQTEQAALLRCLARHHGLRNVMVEGLTPNVAETYRAKVIAVRDMLSRRDELIRQRDDVRAMIARLEAEGKQDTDRYRQAVAIEQEVGALLDQPGAELLELGAAAWLLASGELNDVLPLDDERLLDAARPVSPDGMVRFDPGKVAAREAGIVETAMRHGPVAVVVLGGAHDLTEQARRVGGRTCEYIRVTTRRYAEVARGVAK